jgi:integrase
MKSNDLHGVPPKKIGWPMVLIPTCARRNEIGALEWHDPSGHQIRLEGAQTGNGEEHVIPLSSAA